jgi:uncharacterized protein
MTRSLQANRLNMPAFAKEGVPLAGSTLLLNLERLAQELQAPEADLAVNWVATAELRPATGTSGPDDTVWLHLQAKTAVPLTCQRCMAPVAMPIEVDQWYRFVATEDIAMAEDDESEEDLLVMEPQFDLLALVEDELLMALPLVPMHERCPEAPSLSAASELLPVDAQAEKPNPFAVLVQLKKNQ